MNKKLQRFLLVLLFFAAAELGGFGSAAYAQLYPVQLTPTFNSPYSVKLSDYANSMDTKMQLLVNPLDVSMGYRQVRVKMYLEGNGLQVQSSYYIQRQSPIFINGGTFQALTNIDIGALFRLENLEGISAAQYANGLPEGMYTYCFELYDFVTNKRLSNKSCTSVYLSLNDPPLLNTPQRNEQVMATDFPNILFTWTPRQMNVSNVSYKFELKQILDTSVDPQFGFMMAPLLYQETLFGTALSYSLMMPTLLPGKTYGWRVKATSTTGLSENSVFKNDGYSEIYAFKYATNCNAPTFPLSEVQGTGSAKISWQGLPVHNHYQVQYRKQDVAYAEWFSVYSYNPQAMLSNLESGTSYQFRVGANCEPPGSSPSFTFTTINSFTTPTPNDNAGYQCGIMPAISIQNQTPITNLIVSETFTAGDFPVKILELTNQGSLYSGKGYIVVPYLADTKLSVEFNNITINTDYQLINGRVDTTYDPTWKNVVDLEDFTGEGQGGQIEESVPFVITDSTAITINDSGDIVIHGPNGEQITIPGGKDTVITDSNGTVYYVDSAGNISGPMVKAPDGKPTPENTDGVDSNGQATAFTAQGISISFSGDGSKYSFDVLPQGAPASLQPKYKKVGATALPYKAVVNGQTDTLLATLNITDSSIKPEDVIFKTQNGALIPVPPNCKECTLTLRGSQTYAEEQVLATIKQGDKWKVIGAFMLVHISPKEVNVAFVSLNNAPIPLNTDLEINSYAKAGVKFNIASKTEHITYSDTNADSKLETGNSDFLSVYTTEQQSINAKIKQLPGYSTDTYYLVYSNFPSSQPTVEGFMALKGQFGYVFPDAPFKTGAHELGHGIFGLEHPFATKADENKTNFLMDYSNGNTLWHNDWKQINDPKFRLYMFQGDSEGELAGGFALAPDWSFVRSNSDTVLSGSNIPIVAEGTLGGFTNRNIDQEVDYIWTDAKKYKVNGTGEEYGNIAGEPQVNNVIWLIYNNAQPCGNRKYIKTRFNAELKEIVEKKDFTALNNYIAKYSTQEYLKKENDIRTTYWGSLSCNEGSNTQGNGANSAGSVTINNSAAIPQNYINLIVEQYKNIGVPTQINIYKEGQPVPTTKASNGITLNVKVEYESKSTIWKILEIKPLFDFGGSGTVPSAIVQCLDAKYGEYLKLLESSIKYQTATEPEKLAYKVGLSLYNNLFVIRCYLKAESTSNCVESVVRGAVYELLETINIVQLVLGGEQLVKQLFANCVEKEASYYTTLYDVSKNVVTGTFGQSNSNEQLKTLASVFLPPCVTVQNVEQAIQLGAVLQTEFNTNPCYNSGRLTIAIVPIAFTGGAWAVEKIASLLPALAGKAEKTVLALQKVMKNSWKLERTANKLRLLDETGKEIKNYDQFSEFIDDADNLSGGGSNLRFIAKTADELKTYLSKLTDKPLGKTYNGKLYKSVSKEAELTHNAKPDIISQYSTDEAWGRYDTQGESGMYYSKTFNGNQIEMSHYGDWNAYSTYEFSSVKIDNMLDLTDDVIRQSLGTEFDKLVLGMSNKTQAYEFTNVVGTWAREKGYKGLIVPGARGTKDYSNIIVFNQSDLNFSLNSISPVKIK